VVGGHGDQRQDLELVVGEKPRQQRGALGHEITSFREGVFKFGFDGEMRGRAKGNFWKKNWRQRQFGEVAKRHSRSPGIFAKGEFANSALPSCEPLKTFWKKF
jgi:hypothetical protein